MLSSVIDIFRVAIRVGLWSRWSGLALVQTPMHGTVVSRWRWNNGMSTVRGTNMTAATFVAVVAVVTVVLGTVVRRGSVSSCT